MFVYNYALNYVIIMDPRLVQSQPASSHRPATNYHWVCLFNWCENDQEPFQMYARETTRGFIPESWFSKPLSEQHRQQKATFEPFGNKILSVFAKIEYGNLHFYTLN